MSKALNRDYDALDAPERAALFIMALDRNDEVEESRLSRTAPCFTTYEMHHTKHVRGMCIVALDYRCRQLETVFIHLLLDKWISEIGDEHPDRHRYLWAKLITSWNYIQEMHAFDAFCEERAIKRKAITADGDPDIMDFADEQMTELAPSTEELLEIANGCGFASPKNTVDFRLQYYEDIYSEFTGPSSSAD